LPNTHYIYTRAYTTAGKIHADLNYTSNRDTPTVTDIHTQLVQVKGSREAAHTVSDIVRHQRYTQGTVVGPYRTKTERE
jgi:hypothetical protein